jgi:ferrous iron transport protein A
MERSTGPEHRPAAGLPPATVAIRGDFFDGACGGTWVVAVGGCLVGTLADISIGDHVRVDRVEGDDAISVRLLEMGLTPGVEVSLIGTAPLGDPLEVELRGYRLSLRRSEAMRIAIEST